MNARIFFKEVRFNSRLGRAPQNEIYDLCFIPQNILLILSGSWNFSLRTWCSRIVGLKNLVFSVSTFPLELSVLCIPHPRKYLATPGIELYLGKGVPKCSFFQKIILYECFPIPMAYIRQHQI